MNILNAPFHTKHDTAPFSKIRTEDFLPAFQEAITHAREEIAEIKINPQDPDFANTIEALAYSGERLDRISNIFFNLHSAETSDELQAIAQQVSPMLTEFGNDIRLDPVLFSRVQHVYELRESLQLTPEQATLLDKQYKSFSRNGAALDESGKEKLRNIDKELAMLSLQFGENVLHETHEFELHITDAAQLAGLPDGAIEAARETAQARGKENWVFTLDQPSYLPFVTYADDRELRKKISIAYAARAFRGNNHDNRDIVLKIAKLRFDRARLLGYESHAQFVLEERMAENPQNVNGFLRDLLAKARPAADREFAELTKFANVISPIGTLQKWDGAYYSEKLKQQRFDLDDEMLKPYFQLENVLDGAFTVANKLFGISFIKVDDIDTYHPDVMTYEVHDADGTLVAVFYADFFPRKGKRNGAWMTSFKSQYIRGEVNERPHVSIVCNFTKPTETRPSLLTFNEVTTLFHEFGHALHGMLSNTTYPNLSGTSVYWDFVELPSQIFENWCYEPEALALFARHYQTGELIPLELIRKIKESASFQEGLATLRQLSFGLLDMGWHSNDPSEVADVKQFEKHLLAPTQFYPDVEENAISTSFSHIFHGGYASGYYSYKWAEVLDADAFELFLEQGIFDSGVAARFREHILSKGGTEHPMELYKRFRGQPPSVDALLKRAGLV